MSTPETHHERQRPDPAGEESGTETLTRGAQFVLGTALVEYGRRQQSRRGTAVAIGGAVLVVRALDGPARLKRAFFGRTEDQTERAATDPQARETAVRRSVTIGEAPEELYDRWRDPETFAAILGHFAEVTQRDDDRYRWTVHGPYGQDIGWETHVVDSEPGEFVRWATPTDAVLPSEGTVRFTEAAGDRGTVVTLSVTFDPPGGTLGSAALEQFDIAPKTLVGVALDRFKSLVESGEIPTLSGNPSGRGAGDTV